MFDFFKKTPLLSSYSFLTLDMHSHVLPGIDDGAPDLATSISLIRELHEMLKKDTRKIIVSMIHKFRDAPEGMNTRDNISRKGVTERSNVVEATFGQVPSVHLRGREVKGVSRSGAGCS